MQQAQKRAFPPAKRHGETYDLIAAKLLEL